MQGAVTVHMDATPERVWSLVSDITNTGKFSPETFEAEWLGGARRLSTFVRHISSRITVPKAPPLPVR
jgi:hypothetical protein